MKENFELNASPRTDVGKGASRRLRRTGSIPGVLYGVGTESVSLTINHNEIQRHLEHEAFYSHILTLKLEGAEIRVILKDLQRHPAKPFVMHADFQRVQDHLPLCVRVPVHFTNEAICPGIKQGALPDRNISDALITCLPKDLPEHIDIDMSTMEMGQELRLGEIPLPEGVALHHSLNKAMRVLALRGTRGK